MADRGIRRLLPDELAKAKGVPPDWISQEWMATRDINTMTSLHLWAAVASSLDVTVAQSVYSTPSIPLEQEPVWMVHDDDDSEWVWSAPDLSAGGEWHTARVASLTAAVEGLPDAAAQLAKGLAALDTHRQNYQGDGSIHKLQLLWWEFPPEHWEEPLRVGSGVGLCFNSLGQNSV